MDPSTIRFCAVFLHYTPKTRLSPKLNLGMGPIFRHSRVTSYNPKFLLEGGGTRGFQVRSWKHFDEILMRFWWDSLKKSKKQKFWHRPQAKFSDFGPISGLCEVTREWRKLKLCGGHFYNSKMASCYVQMIKFQIEKTLQIRLMI